METQNDKNNNQQAFEKNKKKTKIAKWRKSLQWYCDMQAQQSGNNLYCVCGNMKYCALCKDSRRPNPCVIAIKSWLDYRGIKINYDDYDFEKLIERIQK